MVAENGETDWSAVTGRALAALCLHLTSSADANMTARAKFLMNLGLARKDAAAVLGTSDDSLRVLLARDAKPAATRGRRATKSPRNA